MAGAFEYVNAVVYDRGKPPKEVDGSYSVWLMNRALSMHGDIVYVAQLLNEGVSSVVSPAQHWEMVKQGVVRRKRKFSWPKKLKGDKDFDDAVKAMMTFYGMDAKSAEAHCHMISDDEMLKLAEDYRKYEGR